jgi:excisionase family DNA binding protein
MTHKSTTSVHAVDQAPAAIPQFSKAKSIASRLGINKKTVMRWADAGHIHRHKVNQRTVLFDISEVLGFVAASRVGDAGKPSGAGDSR